MSPPTLERDEHVTSWPVADASHTRACVRRPKDVWQGLDPVWIEAFSQAWEALRTGNVPVGACVSTADGRLLCSSRNRVCDGSGPAGEVWGSQLAHAEINVLAHVPYRHRQSLVLTTTLEPCLQCSAAIRLAGVEQVRFAGADSAWTGCHEFARLSAREAARRQPVREGPREDEVGLFATLISRIGPAAGGSGDYERWLRDQGEGWTVEFGRSLHARGLIAKLIAMDVDQAFIELWPELVTAGNGREQSRGSSPSPRDR